MSTKDFFNTIRENVKYRREKCLNIIEERLISDIIRDVNLKRKKKLDITEINVNFGSVESIMICPNINIKDIEKRLSLSTGTMISLRVFDNKKCENFNHIGFLGYDPRPKCRTYQEVMANIKWL